MYTNMWDHLVSHFLIQLGPKFYIEYFVFRIFSLYAVRNFGSDHRKTCKRRKHAEATCSLERDFGG